MQLRNDTTGHGAAASGTTAFLLLALMTTIGCGDGTLRAGSPHESAGDVTNVAADGGGLPDSADPCPNPYACCAESERICYQLDGEGVEFGHSFCYCPDVWVCELLGEQTKCQQATPVPGAGDWRCFWTEQTYTCTQPGSPNAPPEGAGLFDCTFNAELASWICTSEAPRPDTPLPEGSADWDCVVDDASKLITCHPLPPVRHETDCSDGIDNDNDGTVDMQDLDCCPTYPCCPSNKIAFVSCDESSGGFITSNGNTVAFKPGPYTIEQLDCETVSANPSLLDGFDTIAYRGEMPRAPGWPLPGATGRDQLVEHIGQRLDAGAKVIVFSHPSITAFWGLTMHKHYNPVATATISVTDPNPVSSTFDAQAFQDAFMDQLHSDDPRWCGDLFFRAPGYDGHFHAYMKDDVATTKGVLFYVGLTRCGMGATSCEETIDFGDPFLASHLDLPWDATTGTSDQCGLTCSKPVGHGVGKPVIYLYPEKEQEVTVELDFEGTLVTTYPPIDPQLGGWRVRARPDGTFTNLADGQEYESIFWNGVSSSFEPDFSTGFVVKGSDTIAFLQQTLAAMGLLPHEYNELIVYWLPHMQHHAYNLIHFATREYAEIAKMRIDPAPDALLRVFMAFKELSAPVAVPPQEIVPFERRGFTVVEWGGSEIGGDWQVTH